MRGGTVAESSDERSVCPPDDSRGWGGAAPVVVLPALRTGDRHIPADAILERGGGQSDHLRVALMPYRAARPCTKPGCPALVRGSSSRCPAHERERDAARGTSSERGYGADWQAARRAFLAEHPSCVACASDGKSVASAIVDHIVPHKGDATLFWDRSNWRAICKRHHDSGTATYDGGFGNPVRPKPC
jgi:5-methylcytosine-specific restriction protein A